MCNRSDPSTWGRYKADMALKLNMNMLAFRADAMKMLNGRDRMASGFYRISGVDLLLAEEETFISAATLRLVDLEELPRDSTMGPLNTRSLTKVRHKARERAPPSLKRKLSGREQAHHQASQDLPAICQSSRTASKLGKILIVSSSNYICTRSMPT